MASNYRLQILAVLSCLASPIQSLQSSSVSPYASLFSTSRAWSGYGARAWLSHNCRRHDIREFHVKGKHLYSQPLFSNSNEVEPELFFDGFAEELLETSSVDSATADKEAAKKGGDSSHSSNEVEPELFFDDFAEELLETSSVDSATADKDAATKGGNSSHFIQGATAVGIGGSDGFVYDVNALKRNLVQESVRGCKQELLVLLGDGRQISQDGKPRVIRWKKDRDDLIEERLSALVQANPVSTTTDSNLLDGEWSFAFETNSASTILDTSRFLLSKSKRTQSSADEWNKKSGKSWHSRAGRTDNPFRSSKREICLENLSGDENAHIIDQTHVLGGLYQTNRRYNVVGLTRTAIDLDLMQTESKLFGIRVGGGGRADFQGTTRGLPLEIQVLYLDTDLCICSAGSGLGLDGPLHVYTKSDSWVTGQAKRKLRLCKKTVSWILTMQSPLRLRQRFMNALAEKNAEIDPGLNAVAIGEFDLNEDGTTKESHSWDGPDDPFAHLAPGERMEVLRTMTLQDIYQSAVERKEQNIKQKKRRWRGKSGRQFKRPDQ